jgi:hypothetical protein
VGGCGAFAYRIQSGAQEIGVLSLVWRLLVQLVGKFKKKGGDIG